jgi:hypothetical protein
MMSEQPTEDELIAELTALTQNLSAINAQIDRMAFTVGPATASQSVNLLDDDSPADRISEEIHAAEAAIAILQTTLQNISERLQDCYLDMDEVVTTAAASFESSADLLGTTIKEVVDQAGAATEQLIHEVQSEDGQQLIDKGQGLIHTADVLANDVESLTERLITDIKSHIHETCEPLVHNLSSDIHNILDIFAKSVDSGGSNSGKDGEAIQAALSVVKPIVDEIMTEFERVRDLGHSLGVL